LFSENSYVDALFIQIQDPAHIMAGTGSKSGLPGGLYMKSQLQITGKLFEIMYLFQSKTYKEKISSVFLPVIKE